MTDSPDQELARMIQVVDEALALPGDERRLRELLYHYGTTHAERRDRLFQALAMLAVTLKAEVEIQHRRTAV